MLGKASIIGAVAAILITPTPVSAQMGGVVDPGVQVGGAVNRERWAEEPTAGKWSPEYQLKDGNSPSVDQNNCA